jgi:hypothetical protein
MSCTVRSARAIRLRSAARGAYFIEEQHIDEIVDKLAAAIDAAVSAVARTSA